MRMRSLSFLCAGFALALAAVACSSSKSNGNAGSGGSSGAGGAATGGSAGSTTGGSGGSSAGGSGGASGGSGGSSGAGAGGTAGSGAGGAAGAGGTGSGGTAGTGGTGGSTSLPTVGGCNVFTGADDWNKDISGEAVDATWTQHIHNIVGSKNIHPDYGGQGQYGIPINVVPASQPKVPITFDQYASESDPGPYPFPSPATAKIEGGTPTNCSGDCHMIVVQQGACMLYEGWACGYKNGGWVCGNGAKWDLTKLSYGQRPTGWTSADAAGLPIMPGLLRWSEVKAGVVKHAIRFTMHCSMNKYVKPATHFAATGSCGADAPPMGLRVRLEASYDISGFPTDAKVILTAMKKYGMILADNGSDFYFQGDADPNWSDNGITPLKSVPASAFEVVTLPPLQP